MDENQTFEEILERMLGRVPDTVDKREGSVIDTALSPAAWELASMYAELKMNMDLSFADTATGEYLTRRVAELGIERKPATKARRKAWFMKEGNTYLDVPLGSRYRGGDVDYIVQKRWDEGQYEVEAEVSGVVGNEYFGALLPIDYIEHLARAELTDVLVAGEDMEDDERLRNRYFIRARSAGTSGNKSDYMQWALEVQSVGRVKVVPLWQGAGTVKVIVLNGVQQPANQDLIEAVLAHIEGRRPIGAKVTVVPAKAKICRICAKVTLATGSTLSQVKQSFIEALTIYLKESAFVVTYLSIAKIGTLLLSTSGVLDYTELAINGGTSNVALHEDEVATLGDIQLEV